MTIEKPISKKTPITIGLVISLLGGSAWLTNVNSQVIQNTEQIAELKDNNEKMIDLLNAQNLMLTRQQAEIGFIKDIVKEIKSKVKN
jgi:hypothetical protein